MESHYCIEVSELESQHCCHTGTVAPFSNLMVTHVWERSSISNTVNTLQVAMLPDSRLHTDALRLWMSVTCIYHEKNPCMYVPHTHTHNGRCEPALQWIRVSQSKMLWKYTIAAIFCPLTVRHRECGRRERGFYWGLSALPMLGFSALGEGIFLQTARDLSSAVEDMVVVVWSLLIPRCAVVHLTPEWACLCLHGPPVLCRWQRSTWVSHGKHPESKWFLDIFFLVHLFYHLQISSRSILPLL